MSEIQFANLVAKFSTVLSVGISDVATSMVLESIATRDGEPLDEGLYAFVIDRGLENEEFVIGTLAETGVFTFLVRGVSYIDGATSIPANIFSHRKGATIEITAHPVLTELVTRFTDFFNTYNGKWSGAVADYASLPEGQNDGEARVTLDDSKIYVWSAAEERWKLAGAGGTGGTVYVTHKLGSESVGGDMKTFVLDSGSFPLDKFLQVYLNGTLQELATDYTTSNNNTIIFENEVEATDKITMLVVSVSLVALGGVLTQDVIPDADEAYNIGSDEYKVNEIHVKELNAANTIDPDNPTPLSPAKLIGGTDVTLSSFTTLGAGANDGAFKVTIDGVEYDDVSIDLSAVINQDDIATAVQTAIRTKTSKEESVIWDTDHFEIYCDGGRSTSILKLESPTTGTDISGAGFLDLSDNATEIAGAGDDYKLVRLDRDGKINKEVIGPLDYFGDGHDGDVIISSNTSLSRDMYYNNLTINNGVTLNPNGYRIFVKETLTNNGTIERNGNPGGDGGNASTGTGACNGSGGGGGGSGSSGGIILISANKLINNEIIQANGGTGGNGGNGCNASGGSDGSYGSAGIGGTAGTALADGSIKGGVAGSAGSDGGSGGNWSQQGIGGNGNNSGVPATPPEQANVIGALTSPVNSSGGKGGDVFYEEGRYVGGVPSVGTAGSGTPPNPYPVSPDLAINQYSINSPSGSVTFYLPSAISPGGSGGGSGAYYHFNQYHGAYGGGQGGCGGTGGSGGVIILIVRSLTNNGLIRCLGGAGGNGGNGGNGFYKNTYSDKPNYIAEDGTAGDTGNTGADGVVIIF